MGRANGCTSNSTASCNRKYGKTVDFF